MPVYQLRFRSTTDDVRLIHDTGSEFLSVGGAVRFRGRTWGVTGLAPAASGRTSAIVTLEPWPRGVPVPANAYQL
jgi:hypothetical protein